VNARVAAESSPMDRVFIAVPFIRQPKYHNL
jgi:hypothetical protein